jgi:hypothetical protein
MAEHGKRFAMMEFEGFLKPSFWFPSVSSLLSYTFLICLNSQIHHGKHGKES